MANEEIMAKVMSDLDLDNVVGGAGYAYFIIADAVGLFSQRRDGRV